jgi:prevent-host-death family protein
VCRVFGWLPVPLLHRAQNRKPARCTSSKAPRLRRVRIFASVEAMCHNVHMKTISIRELHLKTGRWVRHAASRGPIVVTDRGRRVAALQPFDASVTSRPLPNREAAIRKRSKVPVDSVVYQSELREDR